MSRAPAKFAVVLSFVLVACAQPPVPAPVEVAAPVVPAESPLVEERFVLRRGAVPSSLFEQAALPADLRRHAAGEVFDWRDARRMRPGETLVVARRDGRVERVSWEATALEIYDVPVGAAGVEPGALRKLDLGRQVRTARVTIASSLWEAFVDAGEDPGLAVLASDVLAWELDFYRDVRPGDRLDLVVEEETLDGRPVRTGRLLSVRYVGERSRHELVRWNDGTREGWFDRDGRSARRAFLKQPLPLVRITSSFGSRKHPVLGFVKKHEGVDYGAPTGTPVWAVGDGVVEWAGAKGANGILVSLRHPNGVVSHYAHLSRVGVGVTKGARVQQKQVIGHVGTTGRSTGPHLHFALVQGGRYLNPLTQKFAAGEPVAASLRARFVDETTPLLHQLDVLDAVAVTQAAFGPSGILD